MAGGCSHPPAAPHGPGKAVCLQPTCHLGHVLTVADSAAVCKCVARLPPPAPAQCIVCECVLQPLPAAACCGPLRGLRDDTLPATAPCSGVAPVAEGAHNTAAPPDMVALAGCCTQHVHAAWLHCSITAVATGWCSSQKRWSAERRLLHWHSSQRVQSVALTASIVRAADRQLMVCMQLCAERAACKY